ncbi:hypothetical protein BDV59DRAFT_18629 [Aspergillus ambiguus]|uniref:uncharacterized protein n=1 Tax=Aspergillus ambiguus TaxID=176160 RepID=UPI003CCDD762
MMTATRCLTIYSTPLPRSPRPATKGKHTTSSTQKVVRLTPAKHPEAARASVVHTSLMPPIGSNPPGVILPRSMICLPVRSVRTMRMAARMAGI